MPTYNSNNFRPPAPFALVTIRNQSTGESTSNVPMLIDTGADITIVPLQIVEQLRITQEDDADYEVAGFNGASTVLMAVRLEMLFCHKTFRGRFLAQEREWGVVGRNVLNSIALLLDGPNLMWRDYGGSVVAVD